MNDIAVIFEDKDFLVVNKPAGLMVHPVPARAGGPNGMRFEETLTDMLLPKYPELADVGDKPAERPGVVHRLDRDTSDVLVLARRQAFFEYLKKQFQESKVKKTYLALAWGRLPQEGTIDVPIGLKPGTTKRSTRGKAMKMVKEAVTEYRTLERFTFEGEEFSFVRLFPKTGRTHQLRVHLLNTHHPVVGDQLYGKRKNPWDLGRQFLHAESIEFSLPDGRRVRFEAELPEELQRILNGLRGKDSS